MIDERILKSEERATVALRALYKSYGYLPFKMSKFEEYDLYAANKDFLVSDRIITFADTYGKLLALKPDVTLSIIKNTKNSAYKQKLYYNENVYRPAARGGQYKEIMQTGIESIGELDCADIFEVVYLAALSLRTVSDSFMLDISHMGLISAVLDECGAGESFRREALDALSRKSVHELTESCDKYSVSGASRELLSFLASFDGALSEAIETVSRYVFTDAARAALTELSEIERFFSRTELGAHIRADFSAVSNTSYYNGIILSGFINGISDKVLSGGEYSGLLSNMGRCGRAVGFALYLDLLDELDLVHDDFDVDVLLIYSDATDPAKVLDTKDALIKEGKSVSAQRSTDVGIRYRETVDLTKEGCK